MSRIITVKTVLIISLCVSAALIILIWALGGRLADIPHLPDAGASWYYWQLADPTAASRISAWIGYALHQLFIFAVILRARKQQVRDGKLINPFNIAALTGNLLFILLHLVQTHIWYDGLAQDVPIWTSQGSVIVMLVLTLVMLTPKRGFILGIKISIPRNGTLFLQKIHGIFIAWALVYTFWFHPMEGTYGLLSGFFYMFLLFIQLSMFRTKLHYDMKWIVLLETMVAVHGTLITIQKENPIWTMFLSGFLFMFAFTYIHGLTKKRIIAVLTIILYAAAVVLMYSFRGFGRIYEISFIPTALYGGGIALILLLKIFGRSKKTAAN